MDKVRVGIIGGGFVSSLHAEAFRDVPGAILTATCAASRPGAEAFAKQWNIPFATSDYRRILEHPDVDMVVLGIPNDLHREVTVAAAHAGKHVVVEKPLAHTLADGLAMVAACQEHKVRLMYAETLCFSPKYGRAKRLVDEGAIGKLYMAKQAEKHSGPHSEWFYDVQRAGGGVIMDMGCHGIEWARWMYGKQKPKSVVAHCQRALHTRTQGEDNSVIILEFEDGGIALIEDSWAKHGGMDDRIELYGREGVIHCDLLHGSSMETYSVNGYGYAVEKAGETKGWTFTAFEETYLYGFPHELRHFTNCVLKNETPREVGEDGLATLEIIYAAYESAGAGRRITWPYTPKNPEDIPANLWLKARGVEG